MSESQNSDRQEYVSIKALECELEKLMARKGITSWLQTAFDATDIDWLIHEIPEEHIIVLDSDGVAHRADRGGAIY